MKFLCCRAIGVAAAMMVLAACDGKPVVKPTVLDAKGEKLVEDFLSTHTIDSLETDEQVLERIRSEVAEGRIQRNEKNGDVGYVSPENVVK